MISNALRIKVARKAATHFIIALAFVCAVPVPGLPANKQIFDHDIDHEMVFYTGGTGGNCGTCRWIIAEGRFVSDTPRQFNKFLDRLIPHIPSFVHFSSQGGNLLAGLEVGEIIRKRLLSAYVSKTIGELTGGHVTTFPDGNLAQGGICASACVYAFLGGAKRFAISTHYQNAISVQGIPKIGIHQFYSERALGAVDEKVFDSLGRSRDQVSVGLLLEYVTRMGGNAPLISLASVVAPSDIHWLTDAELRDTGLENAERKYDTSLQVIDRDTGALEIQFSDFESHYRALFFCKGARKKPTLVVKIVSKHYIAAEQIQDWRLYRDLTLETETKGQHRKFQVKLDDVRSRKTESGSLVDLVLSFPDAQMTDFGDVSRFRFVSGASRYASEAAAELSFELVSTKREVALLSRTCGNQ